jgi:hypothetical protein
MVRKRDKGYPRQEQDFYATEAWATRGLLEKLRQAGIDLPNAIWEPCCGDGAISKEMEAEGYSVFSTDLVYRG